MKQQLRLQEGFLFPGARVAVAVSGGADSVALLLALAELRNSLGLVLSVAHVHHGIRGASADGDLALVESLAARFECAFHLERADVPARAKLERASLEEAARTVRYSFFRRLIDDGLADLVATAHTADDQAETVLLKLMRGAWTEGLSGIYPRVAAGRGAIVRPLLGASRSALVAYLDEAGQSWREDETNREPRHTRNRVRGELLPLLRTFNPQITGQLARLASTAREEEDWWSSEVARLLPSLLLPGRPTRGGGRRSGAASEEPSWAIELERLRTLSPPLQRRVLRAAVARFGQSLDFDHVEGLLTLCGLAPDGFAQRAQPDSPRKQHQMELPHGLVAERTPRELRLARRAADLADPSPAHTVPIPGELTAEEIGLAIRTTLTGHAVPPVGTLVLRTAQTGDRVSLPHRTGAKTVKEVLQRAGVPPRQRKTWPVVAWNGTIVWMRAVPLDFRVMLGNAGFSLEVVELPKLEK